jgi:hypothetical protein
VIPPTLAVFLKASAHGSAEDGKESLCAFERRGFNLKVSLGLVHRVIPDSAVPADAMSEEQTFRSEVNGSLPLSGYRSSVVQDEI